MTDETDTPEEALGDRPEIEPEGPVETPSEEHPNTPSNSDSDPGASLEPTLAPPPPAVPAVDGIVAEDGRARHMADENDQRMIVGASGEGAALRVPVEKGNQEGKIGVVDRTLTPLGEEIGITHGVVSHDLRAAGDEPSEKLPYMRCPNCGNVNITLHSKDRTVASCPACLWHSGSLHSTKPNPADRIPGMHETPGTFIDAGEIPKGKLEGALGMDPLEAKQGVPVETVSEAQVTTFHLDSEGKPILGGTRPFVKPVEDYQTNDAEGAMPGNIGTDVTSTKNRR